MRTRSWQHRAQPNLRVVYEQPPCLARTAAWVCTEKHCRCASNLLIPADKKCSRRHWHQFFDQGSRRAYHPGTGSMDRWARVADLPTAPGNALATVLRNDASRSQANHARWMLMSSIRGACVIQRLHVAVSRQYRGCCAPRQPAAAIICGIGRENTATFLGRDESEYGVVHTPGACS